MTKMPSIDDTFALLTGKPAWGLARTHGSMFFLEIGQPLPRESTKKIHGEWHFLIEMCHWRLETQEAILVGSDDDPELIDSTFQRLPLGVIKEINSPLPSHDLRLLFSSGVRLCTFVTSITSASAEDQWIYWNLYCPDDNVWSAKSSGDLLYQNIDE